MSCWVVCIAHSQSLFQPWAVPGRIDTRDKWSPRVIRAWEGMQKGKTVWCQHSDAVKWPAEQQRGICMRYGSDSSQVARGQDHLDVKDGLFNTLTKSNANSMQKSPRFLHFFFCPLDPGVHILTQRRPVYSQLRLGPSLSFHVCCGDCDINEFMLEYQIHTRCV